MIFLSAAAATADVIYLRDGEQLEGKVIEKKDGYIGVRTDRGIVFRVPEADVSKVIESDTPLEVYKQMAARIKPGDAEGHYNLAAWCRRQNLREEMKDELAAAIKADPNHEAARRDLGYVKTDKGWVTQEQMMEAQGKVLADGKWVAKDDAKKLSRAELEKQYLYAINTAVYKIHTGSAATRRDMLEKLSKFSDPLMGQKILSLLEDRDEAVRIAVCSSLAAMKFEPALVPLFERAMVDESADIRSAALEALATIDRVKAASMFQQVIPVIKTKTLSKIEDQRTVKRQYVRIAQGLGACGDIRSVPYLINILYPKIELNGLEPSGIGVFRSGGDGLDEHGLPKNRQEVTGLGFRYPTPDPEKYFFNEEAEQVLKKITGQNLGVNPKDWRRWWSVNGSELIRENASKDAKEKQDD